MLPLAVVFITFNEAHNIERALKSVCGWASDVVVVDSFSVDNTVDLAIKYGARVYQRKFDGFGSQWNYALARTLISQPWVMKLDPDEQLSDELMNSIERFINDHDQYFYAAFLRKLYFMGKPLPVVQSVPRLWKNGRCHFSDVTVNEQPLIDGKMVLLQGELIHYDSPNLHHWYQKQNTYSTLEALQQIDFLRLSYAPKLLGNPDERRMWFKKYFWKTPFRYFLLYFYHLVVLGAFKAGYAGFVWARLRTEYYRSWEYKYYEFRNTDAPRYIIQSGHGSPDPRAIQTKDQ